MAYKKNPFEDAQVPAADAFELETGEHCDEGIKQRFIAHCLEHGIRQEQAQSLVEFQKAEQENTLEQACSCSEKALKQLWGSRYARELQKAKNAVIILDRKLGGKLIPFFESGYGNHPVLIEMLATVGSLFEEDTIGVPAQGSAGDKAMSTEDFLTKVVFKQQ